jgi:hypothetical protein
MKHLLAIAGLGLALTGCMTTAGWSEAPLDDRHYADVVPVGWWGRDVASVDIFTGALAQYGSWGTHARYGRVFLPGGVGPDWQPYSRGHWRQDPRFGRMFVSTDPWGWATYHYGRWGRDARFGWFWVPDTRFGPSWVDWRAGGGFASWSPLPPPGWSSWGYGWGNDWWVHAPGAWVYRPGLHGHVRRGPHGWDGRRDWNRDRDRDWDRDRTRVDRTRPGESPMAGFVRNRVPPPAPAVAPPVSATAATAPPAAPPAGWIASRPGSRPPRADGAPMGGFVRNRVQPDAAPGLQRVPAQTMVAPPHAVPAEARVAPPRAVMSAPPREAPPREAPPPRAERPQRSYERASRAPTEGRGYEGRYVQQRVADD